MTEKIWHVKTMVMEKKYSLLILKIVVLVAAVLAAAGCQTRLQQLQNMPLSGSEYHVALAQEYLAFAESEADQYDWVDSRHFAMKGLNAASGMEVQPENLSRWDIKGDIKPAILQARGYLMDVLKSPLTETKGEAVARAQVLFDCWLEQQEEAWQEEDIKSCREGFYDELDVLYAELYPKAVIAEPVVERVDTPLAVAPGPFRVYFGFNKTSLDANAKEVIHRAVSDLRSLPKFTIMLNGYADNTGKAAYNMKLSKKRALEVKKALVDAGVDEDVILVFAFGEASPSKDKKNLKRDNRVVEIVVELNS